MERLHGHITCTRTHLLALQVAEVVVPDGQVGVLVAEGLLPDCDGLDPQLLCLGQLALRCGQSSRKERREAVKWLSKAPPRPGVLERARAGWSGSTTQTRTDLVLVDVCEVVHVGRVVRLDRKCLLVQLLRLRQLPLCGRGRRRE